MFLVLDSLDIIHRSLEREGPPEPVRRYCLDIIHRSLERVLRKPRGLGVHVRLDIIHKSRNFIIDDDLKTRDLGISFLRSYVKLYPDYICVLHPLSYLVKPYNFKLMGNFTKQYKLIDGLVISSRYFTNGLEFPIIIALYERGDMSFDYIKDFNFKVEDGAVFKLNDFDFIGNYLSKYPKKEVKNPAGYFYAMRDINALKRNKTFLAEKSANAITIERKELPYYHYVNLFKKYAKEHRFGVEI